MKKNVFEADERVECFFIYFFFTGDVHDNSNASYVA